jgi:hypothetical protein
MSAGEHGRAAGGRSTAGGEIEVPADPDPFERILIDGEPWVWVPEASRWVLESVLPEERPDRLTGSGRVG